MLDIYNCYNKLTFYDIRIVVKNLAQLSNFTLILLKYQI